MLFYLKPDFSKINGSVVVGAMNQAFFTLSVGMGGMAIFGSYIGQGTFADGRSRSMLSHWTLSLLYWQVSSSSLPASLMTLKSQQDQVSCSILWLTVFNNMAGGRLWGTLFFLFMIFAAMSTVLGVCENILAMIRELTGWSRPKGSCIVLRRWHSCLASDDGSRLQPPPLPAASQQARHGWISGTS